MLTPFLKAVTKVLSTELGSYFDSEEKEALFDQVLQNLPTGNSASNFSTNLSQASETLKFEFDQLKRINIE